MEITAKRLRELERAQRKLNCLEAGGVDNWEWYGESLKEFHKEEELGESLEDFIDSLNDLLAEADVDEPAGLGCGYSITISEEQEEFLKKLIREIVEEQVRGR